MNRRTSLAVAAALLPLTASAQVTMFFTAANLYQTIGPDVLMPESGLVVLVVSTADTAFSEITPASTFNPGFSLNGGDDLVLAKWNLDAPGQLIDKEYSLVGALGSVSGSWNEGDPLRIYWFPSLTLASTSPFGGTTYNYFPRHEDNIDGPADTGANAWVSPGNGGFLQLEFITDDADPVFGVHPKERGLANLTVVPEPSFYAGVFAAGCMAWAAVSRRRRNA